MKTRFYKQLMVLSLFFVLVQFSTWSQAGDDYLKDIRSEMKVKWPANRTINLVFHGHSVPSGYYTGGVVEKFGAYPHFALLKIKASYPYAVMNSITTSIGGEQAEQGAARFQDDVLNHKPDVLFIDYALNDRSMGLARAEAAWRQMIEATLAYRFTTKDGVVRGTKLYLMTPTPDTHENILLDSEPLAQHAAQIRRLAKEYNVGLVDSYAIFKRIAAKESLAPYMAQANHINGIGHKIVGDSIAALFTKIDLFADGIYYIKGKYTTKFMTVKDNSTVSGSPIEVRDSAGVQNQKFRVTKTPTGYVIEPLYNAFVLGMNNEGVANGDALVQTDSSASLSTRFTFEDATQGYYRLINVKSNRYIATPGKQNVNGTPVIQWQFYNDENYKWRFIPVEETTPLQQPFAEPVGAFGIRVFPNPTSGSFTITKEHTAPLNLKISDLSGKLVLEYTLASAVSELALTNTLTKGIYVLKFTDGTRTTDKQLILQ